jgi:hypothetical protein
MFQKTAKPPTLFPFVVQKTSEAVSFMPFVVQMAGRKIRAV